MHIVFKVNIKDTRVRLIDVRLICNISTVFIVYMVHEFAKWFSHGLVKINGLILHSLREKIVGQETQYGF